MSDDPGLLATANLEPADTYGAWLEVAGGDFLLGRIFGTHSI